MRISWARKLASGLETCKEISFNFLNEIFAPLMNPNSTAAHRTKLQQLSDVLRHRIRGQEHVLPRVVSILQHGELGLSSSERPKGSFLFLGPTGVGKTELTLAFTEFLLGKEKVFRFD